MSSVMRSVRVDRVLCAVTFSRSSRRVLTWAASLARLYEGEVRLFHVAPDFVERAPASDADSERALKKLFALSQHLPGRPRISAAVAAGDAAEEIVRHARLLRADVIAVGMHAQDGSVSPLIARLALDAPCPVLVVDETVAAPAGYCALDQIVLAVDFLPASLAATDYAFAFAHAAGARVTVVHVLPEHWEGPARRDANVDEVRQQVEHHFRQLLRIAVSAVPGASWQRDALVTSGRPCVEIVRLAAARDADLLVMGVDGFHQSPQEYGETSSCVMQFARRTVLLVPERVFRTPRVRRG